MKICEKCGCSFITNYTSTKGVKYQVHSVRFCSKGCATASRYRSGQALKLEIISFIKISGRYNVLSEITTNCNVSSKTLVKYGLKIRDLNKEAGYTNSKNYFEDKVSEHLKELLPGVEILRQYQLPELINPITGYKLYLDFYIPSLGICIEADGAQHYDCSSQYYTKAGVYRDSLKDLYFGSKMIRIKYSRTLTQEYILKNLIDNPELSSLLTELESATTIPSGSTSQVNGDGSGSPLTDNAEGDDIVSSI